MELYNFIKSQASYYKDRLAELSEELCNYPEGTFRCYPNGGTFSHWISYPDGKRTYLSKNNYDLKQKMAEKSIVTAEISDCHNNLMACERFLDCYDRHPANAVDKALENAGLCKILSKSGNDSKDKQIQQWINEPYEKNPKYPEFLTVQAINGEKVRSKSEAMCIQLLYFMNIPFRYEQKHTIGGYDFYPDFTILNPKDQSIVLIEIFGMMDDPGYVSHTFSKLHIYANNGFIPDQNLLCFFELSSAPLDMMFMKITLEYFFNKK